MTTPRPLLIRRSARRAGAPLCCDAPRVVPFGRGSVFWRSVFVWPWQRAPPIWRLYTDGCPVLAYSVGVERAPWGRVGQRRRRSGAGRARCPRTRRSRALCLPSRLVVVYVWWMLLHVQNTIIAARVRWPQIGQLRPSNQGRALRCVALAHGPSIVWCALLQDAATAALPAAPDAPISQVVGTATAAGTAAAAKDDEQRGVAVATA